MEKNRRGGWWALTAVAFASVLLLLGSYIGAYFALVEPVAVPMGGMAAPNWLFPPSPRYPSGWMYSFFSPMHKIDHDWIRPDLWKPEFEESLPPLMGRKW